MAYSSQRKELYNLAAFIVHAASLCQAFAHCRRFLAAASRRSLGRVSVPVWPYTLSGRLSIVALVGRYPTNWLMDRRLIQGRSRKGAFPPVPKQGAYSVLSHVSMSYPQSKGRSPTCYSPVRHSQGNQHPIYFPSFRIVHPVLASSTVRLACLKRAASVRSEPGSNSP